jgi:hypothetical protein
MDYSEKERGNNTHTGQKYPLKDWHAGGTWIMPFRGRGIDASSAIGLRIIEIEIASPLAHAAPSILRIPTDFSSAWRSNS